LAGKKLKKKLKYFAAEETVKTFRRASTSGKSVRHDLV
jgi:hypothetical protein